MADTPPTPPGWPYNQDPNATPPPPGTPAYEPPPAQAAPGQPPAGAPHYQPPPQAAPPGQPPAGAPHYQPPPQAAPPGQPPAPYPAAAPAQPYEPPVPGAPPAAYPPAAQPAYAPPPQPAQSAQSAQYGGPGQPPPPPGWGAPAAPVKKSRRSLWTSLAIIFGVLVLGIGACTFWFIGTVTAPVDTSNDFLAAIDNGDYAAAIAFSDPLCSQGMSADDLARAFQGADISYNLNNSSITNSSATVSGSFSVVGENVSSIEVYLRNNDGWGVCGFNAE